MNDVEKYGSLELFGKRLKECRLDKNLTTRELAEIINKSEANINRYEHARHGAGRNAIALLAKTFGVNPSWLMGVEGAEKYETKKESTERKIPLLGYIAAGHPILAQENIIGYETTDDDSSFALKVKGDSMINARIFDGDVVFVRKQEDVEHGEIAAVLIDNHEATLKRIYKVNGSIILHAENPTFQDMVFGKKDKQIQIIGKVTYVKFKAR